MRSLSFRSRLAVAFLIIAPFIFTSAHADDIWVEFGHTATELGTEAKPFNTIAEAMLAISPRGGDTIKIGKSGPVSGTKETPTFSTPVTIEATAGPITIGAGTQALYTYFTGWGAVVYDSIGMDATDSDYSVNPESREYADGTKLTAQAYPADTYRFDSWWYPRIIGGPVVPEDILPATIHTFAMDRQRVIWPVFVLNTEGYDLADPDDDGLANYREAEFGTDPADADTDNDGLPDGWEKNYRLDPLSSVGNDGATGNPDGDAYDNLAEYQQGFDPRIDDSLPAPSPPAEPDFLVNTTVSGHGSVFQSSSARPAKIE